MDRIKTLEKLRAFECRDSSFLDNRLSIVLKSGSGSRVKDTDNNEYIDMCAGFGALALGHNHPVLRQCLKPNDQMLVHGMGDVFPSREKVDLISEISTVLPFSNPKTSLALSGSQAVEYALKTAMLKTSRHGFISFQGGYHGLDLGALAVTARAQFRSPFSSNEKLHDHVVHCRFGTSISELHTELTRAKNLLDNRDFGLAGIIVEPVQGRAGIKPAKTLWLSALRDFCDQTNALLIFDEIMTGLGRSGKWNHADDACPDLICYGKILGGGLPLSSCSGTTETMDAWPLNRGEGLHTGTFFGHPLACRTGLATLKHIKSNNLIEHSLEKSKAICSVLSKTYAGRMVEVRARGLLIGVEFEEDGAGVLEFQRLLKNGILSLPAGERGEVLSFTPALNIPSEDIEEFAHRIESFQ